MCSLCADIIKLILPFKIDGGEVETYLSWVYDSSPPLPPGFRKGMTVWADSMAGRAHDESSSARATAVSSTDTCRATDVVEQDAIYRKRPSRVCAVS
jgi:hypothetical protein